MSDGNEALNTLPHEMPTLGAHAGEPKRFDTPSRQHLIAAARRDIVTFTESGLKVLVPDYAREPVIELMASFAGQAISSSEGGMWCLTAPPRVLKTSIGICAAAYYLGRNPQRSVMVVSHTDRVADHISAQTKRLMTSTFYRSVFPGASVNTHDRKDDFGLEAGGGRLGFSIASSVTGRGADLMILDDPISANQVSSAAIREGSKQVFEEALKSRSNTHGGGIFLLISQRLHPADMTAHFLDMGARELSLSFEAEADEKYVIEGVVYERNAGELLQPSRTSPAQLAELKRTTSNAIWSTQYQQRVVLDGLGPLRRDFFLPVDVIPKGGEIYVSWDIAHSLSDKASWTVALVIRVKGDVYYLERIVRERCDYDALRSRALYLQKLYAPKMHLIEATSVGPALCQDLRKGNANVIPITPRGSKVERVEARINVFRDLAVRPLASLPQLPAFLDEMASFPHGVNDDMVDALSQFLNWHSANKPTQKEVVIKGLEGTGRNTRAKEIQRLWKSLTRS